MSVLANRDPATAWEHVPWVDFARGEAGGGRGAVVVLPLHGMTDHGLGLPLDAEEVLGSELLRRAAGPAGVLVMAPLRWVVGPHPWDAFAVDFETAHAAVQEVAASVKAAGFRKLCFFNTSPWNEEFVDAASRDVRVGLGLQTFCVQLEGLGLDFHPLRSSTRQEVQAAVVHLLGGVVPGRRGRRRAPRAVSAFRPQTLADPGFEPWSGSADSAARVGGGAVEAAAGRLAGLLGEVAARPPLACGGAIPEVAP